MALKFTCPNCGDVKIAKYLNIGDSLACGMCAYDFHVPDDAEYIEGDSSILTQMKDEPGSSQLTQSKINPEILYNNLDVSPEIELKPSEPTPWGIKSILKFFLANLFVFFCIGCFLGIVATILIRVFNPGLAPDDELYTLKFNQYMSPVFILMSLFIPVALVYYTVVKRHHQNFFEALRLMKPTKEFIIKSAKIALGIVFVLSVFDLLFIFTPLGNLIPDDVPMIEYLGDTYPEIILFSLFALLAPFAEEIIFRGYLFQGLRHSFDQRASAIIVTVMFVMLHGAQLSFSPTLLALLSIVSITLIVVRIKTDNLTNCIIIHFIYNLSLVVLLWIMIMFLGLEKTLAV